MTSLDFAALLKKEKLKYRNLKSEAAAPSNVSALVAPSSSPAPPIANICVDPAELQAPRLSSGAPELTRPLNFRDFGEQSISEFHLNGTGNKSDSLPLHDYQPLTSDSSAVPPSLYYIPEFISADDEAWLLSQIYSTAAVSNWVTLQTRRLQCYRDNVSLGADSSGSVGGASSPEQPFLPFVTRVVDAVNASSLIQDIRTKCVAAGRCSDWGVPPSIQPPRPPSAPAEGVGDALPAVRSDAGTAVDTSAEMNHVLINEYQPGQGIMHHTDGPLYTPFVLIISLESSVLITFKRRLQSHEIGSEVVGEQGTVFSVVLQARSAFIFSNDAYSCFLHGIDDTHCDHIGDINTCVNKHLCPHYFSAVGGTTHADGGAVSIDTDSPGAAVPSVPVPIVRKKRISLTIRHII